MKKKTSKNAQERGLIIPFKEGSNLVNQHPMTKSGKKNSTVQKIVNAATQIISVP